MMLEKIITNRLRLLKKEKQDLPLVDIRNQVDQLIESGRESVSFLGKYIEGNPFLIAEIKKASPSKGIIRKDFDIKEITNVYEKCNFVNAISVLTEPDFFWGRYEYIQDIKNITRKPVLMKDFIIDSYQIYKGFLLGSSSILLIASVLGDEQIEEFIDIAKGLDMDVLFETHSIEEYKRSLNFDVTLIGINNRNLKTFITDVNNSITILHEVGKYKGRVIISESGIDSFEDIKLLKEGGVDGFLIGERFMRDEDVEKAIHEVMGGMHGKTTG